MDNDDFSTEPQGFHRYVEKSDFNKFTTKVDTTFYGKEGSGGIVADIQILKTKVDVAEGLIKWALGSSLIGTLLAVVTLLKLFNVI